MDFAQESVFSRMTDSDHRIIEYYDSLYAEGGGKAYPPDFTRIVLQKLCRKVKLAAGAHVLDVGCATGFYSALFHEAGYDVTGIDLSETGIRRARELYPAIRFEVQDANALPYPEESFDLVFAMGVSVANTADVERVRAWLAHLLSVTRSGGTVAFLGGSTLTGDRPEDSGWVNHRWTDIRSFVPQVPHTTYGPWLTHFRLMKSLPPWLSMSAVTTQTLRLLPLAFQRRIVLLLRK